MNYAKFAQEIHEQSVAHGWWENPDLIEKLTMIHSEISEAVDEYRNGRPMVYVLDLEGDEAVTPRYEIDVEKFGGRKPEGIAVELADVCIRVFDLVAYMKAEEDLEVLDMLSALEAQELTLCHMALELHDLVSEAYRQMRRSECVPEGTQVLIPLVEIVYVCMHWLRKAGCDLWRVMRIKHEYNKGRAYRHGGKKC